MWIVIVQRMLCMMTSFTFFLTNLLNVMLCYDIHLEKSSSCFCVLVNIFFYMLHFIN